MRKLEDNEEAIEEAFTKL
ncbi:hypothetical protein BN1708_001344 [Verticillium longisporum]|uniref:Uncharacterized protein n=1 Tax=Verticillium longisporum TaxID=100787 RepID=A0A0G4MN34_VERLO|nr:hypothetical protein BN1708_001344 [Verticillium longisporum]